MPAAPPPIVWSIRFRPGARLVVDDAVYDAVGPQRQPPSGARRGQRDPDAREIRAGDAAPLARAAVVAGGAPAVRLREDRDPADRHDPLAREVLGDAVPDHLLGAVQRHRGEELAVGQLRQAKALAADAGEPLDVIVPRRDVGVADRPVHAQAVARVGLEVEVAPAVHLPPPHDGPAAYLASADPVKRLVGIDRVGILPVVDEKLAAVLVAGVAVPLNELVPFQRLAVAEAAELHLPGRDVLDVVPRGIDRPPGLEHQRAEPTLAQLLRRPAARDARPNHDR